MPRKAPLVRDNSRVVAAKEGQEFLAACGFDPSAKRQSKRIIRVSEIPIVSTRSMNRAKQMRTKVSRQARAQRTQIVAQAAQALRKQRPKTLRQKKSRLAKAAAAIAPIVPVVAAAAPAPVPVQNQFVSAGGAPAPIVSPPKQLPVVWKYQSNVPSFALALSVKDNAVVFGNNAGEVLAFDFGGKVLGNKIQLPSGVKTIVADGQWLYAGCDNGAIYDLTNRAEPRAIYSLPSVDELLLDAPSVHDFEEAAAANVPSGAAAAELDPSSMDVESINEKCVYSLLSSYKRWLFFFLLKRPAVQTQQLKTKHVVFVLDTSGSMYGAKINAALANIRSIYFHNLRPTDKVSYVKFDSTVKLQFYSQTRRDNDAEIQRSLVDSYCTGWTALYDAMAHAYALLARTAHLDEEQWVIALTDGDDNKSANSTFFPFRYVCICF